MIDNIDLRRLEMKRFVGPRIQKIRGRWYAIGGNSLFLLIEAERFCEKLNKKSGGESTAVTFRGGSL